MQVDVYPTAVNGKPLRTKENRDGTTGCCPYKRTAEYLIRSESKNRGEEHVDSNKSAGDEALLEAEKQRNCSDVADKEAQTHS